MARRDWFNRTAPRYPPEEGMAIGSYELVYQVCSDVADQTKCGQPPAMGGFSLRMARILPGRVRKITHSMPDALINAVQDTTVDLESLYPVLEKAFEAAGIQRKHAEQQQQPEPQSEQQHQPEPKSEQQQEPQPDQQQPEQQTATAA